MHAAAAAIFLLLTYVSDALPQLIHCCCCCYSTVAVAKEAKEEEERTCMVDWCLLFILIWCNYLSSSCCVCVCCDVSFLSSNKVSSDVRYVLYQVHIMIYFFRTKKPVQTSRQSEFLGTNFLAISIFIRHKTPNFRARAKFRDITGMRQNPGLK